MSLLQVENLQVQFMGNGAAAVGVSDVSFTVEKGKNLAIVGESGSGKSVSSLACMGLIGGNGKITAGTIKLNGEDITNAKEKTLRRIRGAQVSMIFQEPMTSLNPLLTIGFQIREALKLHTDKTKKEIQETSIEALRRVGIPDPDKALGRYAHELSGGMRQRVMIAMALACGPELLIADEPTTALDVTIQSQILSLIKQLQRETGTTVLIITHDFGVVAEIADEVVVMYAGLAVETGDVREIFKNPLHPYTVGLLKSIIPIDASADTTLYSIPGYAAAVTKNPDSCPFYPRCAFADGRCETSLPPLKELRPGHFARCFAT